MKSRLFSQVQLGLLSEDVSVQQFEILWRKREKFSYEFRGRYLVQPCVFVPKGHFELDRKYVAKLLEQRMKIFGVSGVFINTQGLNVPLVGVV